MIKLLDIRYIGWVKTRADGTQAANSWSNGGWTVLLTKTALYQFFGLAEKPGEASTLYNVLGIVNTVNADEIKTAYRRLAKQWHPDTCKERDTREQFETIKNAYDILSQPTRRAKYDAGLALQATLVNVHRRKNTPSEENPLQIYRSPLRCGFLLCEGHEMSVRSSHNRDVNSKFIVDKILQWQDITNSRGQTLVVSWKYGDDHYTEAWV